MGSTCWGYDSHHATKPWKENWKYGNSFDTRELWHLTPRPVEKPRVHPCSWRSQCFHVRNGTSHQWRRLTSLPVTSGSIGARSASVIQALQTHWRMSGKKSNLGTKRSVSMTRSNSRFTGWFFEVKFKVRLSECINQHETSVNFSIIRNDRKFLSQIIKITSSAVFLMADVFPWVNLNNKLYWSKKRNYLNYLFCSTCIFIKPLKIHRTQKIVYRNCHTYNTNFSPNVAQPPLRILTQLQLLFEGG